MSTMRLAGKTLGRTLSERWSVQTCLCPSLVEGQRFATILQSARQSKVSKASLRSLYVQSTRGPASRDQSKLWFLPWTCPGCGAYTQTLKSDSAGYYSPSRKAVESYVAVQKAIAARGDAGEANELPQVTKHTSSVVLESLDPEEQSLFGAETGQLALDAVPAPPVCNRCHDLLHHSKGTSIVHPTIQSIQDIIADSPYKYNHVYHILDAADFPLSLIPQLQQRLSLMPQRSLNRRAKTSKFYHGQKSEMSFVITRSDLLAPTKEHVDSMMPYLTEVLRDALGSTGKDVRLGNVRCVSSQRGWWTTKLKEEIWQRGNGGWMVGKVNVGKSSLLETVFPKGSYKRHMDQLPHFSMQGPNARQEAVANQSGSYIEERFDQLGLPNAKSPLLEDSQDLQGESLLPPAPMETDFPIMPIVSSLPGTTASPIRLPFGNGRGELVDLPGLDRGNLETFVKDEHRLDLVMQHRVKPEQHVLKPGQSLIISGLIRITPTTPDIVLLAYPFMPLNSHITSTEKATAIQTQTVSSGVSSITKPGAGERMKSAGVFELKWDVTRQRAEPLTAPAAVGLKPQVLPFAVFSTDILIEGCGWVELVAQVRKKALQDYADDREAMGGGIAFPKVEVFSPDGNHIGARRPMNAWLLGGHQQASRHSVKARPRRSMKGVKKNLKKLARESMTALME